MHSATGKEPVKLEFMKKLLNEIMGMSKKEEMAYKTTCRIFM